MEFFRKEFPKTYWDFLALARPIKSTEIELAPKETLIQLCCDLKRKELDIYIKYGQLQHTVYESINLEKDIY